MYIIYDIIVFAHGMYHEAVAMDTAVVIYTCRDQWVTLITKAHINYLQKKKQMEKAHRERQRKSIKGSIARLVVTVVEAADLKASDPNGKSITLPNNPINFSQIS